MPARKRKKDETATRSKAPPFLLLPLEVRLKIYEFSYLAIYCDFTSAADSANPRALSKRRFRMDKRASRKERQRLFSSNSLCDYPLSHQSLLLTCRQIYNEFWPLYLTTHSIGFDHPIKFANDYLSFQTLERMKMIKHLSLTIISGLSTYNLNLASVTRDITHDVRRLFEHYSDLFSNLLSFTWEVQDRRNYTPMQHREHAQEMYLMMLQMLSNQHKRERLEHGMIDTEGINQPTLPSKRWRAGLVLRERVRWTSGIDRWTDHASMLYFEQLPTGAFHCECCAKGLRYINVKAWLDEPLPPEVDPKEVSPLIWLAEVYIHPPDPEKVPLYTATVERADVDLLCESRLSSPSHGIMFDIGV